MFINVTIKWESVEKMGPNSSVAPKDQRGSTSAAAKTMRRHNERICLSLETSEGAAGRPVKFLPYDHSG